MWWEKPRVVGGASCGGRSPVTWEEPVGSPLLGHLGYSLVAALVAGPLAVNSLFSTVL